MGLNTQLSVSLRPQLESSVGGLAIPVHPEFNFNQTLEDGSIVNKANKLWFHKGRTLASAASEELDLAGVLTDVYGAVITFTKIKGLYIYNKNTVAGDTLKVGGAAANQFLLFDDATDKITVGPGGVLLFWDPSLAGRAVTGGTGDKLKLEAPGANTVTFDIAIIGVG